MLHGGSCRWIHDPPAIVLPEYADHSRGVPRNTVLHFIFCKKIHQNNLHGRSWARTSQFGSKVSSATTLAQCRSRFAPGCPYLAECSFIAAGSDSTATFFSSLPPEAAAGNGEPEYSHSSWARVFSNDFKCSAFHVFHVSSGSSSQNFHRASGCWPWDI